jgi:multidrug transporter EmrE-like cation transporter
MNWLLASVMFQSASVAFAKQAALTSQPQALLSLLLSPYYFASLLMLGFQAICWIIVVRRFPLSVAYPVSSFSLAVNLVVASTLFGEVLGLNHYLGIGLILWGVFFLYPRSEGEGS